MWATISCLVGSGFFASLHDLTGLAVAALRHLLGLPRHLQRVRLAAAQPFDGGDLLARGVLGRGLARAHRDAVEMHGAGAAQAGAATELGAGHLQLLADDPEQRRVVGRVDLTRLTVDGERDHVPSVAVAVELSRRAHRLRMRTLFTFYSSLAGSCSPPLAAVKKRYSISGKRRPARTRGERTPISAYPLPCRCRPWRRPRPSRRRARPRRRQRRSRRRRP